MTDPCNKGPDIDKLNTKVDHLSAMHRETSADLKQAIDKLTSVLMADIETRAEVEQLKKDRDALYGKYRSIDARVDVIEVRNAKCDGAGIFERFPTVWDWMVSEKGWRRVIPGVCAVICTVVAVMTFMAKDVQQPAPSIADHSHKPYSTLPKDAKMP